MKKENINNSLQEQNKINRINTTALSFVIKIKIYQFC